MDNDERAAGMHASFIARAQYIKDLSFESPGAPRSLTGAPPHVEMSATINSREAGANAHEVELKMRVRATRGEDVVFIVKLTYAGIFRIAATSDSGLRAATRVECPRFLFPFARRIVADCVRDGGFPQLLLSPIDFGAQFRRPGKARQSGGDSPPARTLN